MAPSRRKGSNSKAAATAAACRKWKVGDLVLAKVKGFPAWPATVSEPEKWGYSRDWKKVLVYFFGTQQIAFCNPVDVEAFTEEKKQSLLVKRRGKGADFIRAVHEIIDCFEKSKEGEQPVNCNSTDEVAVSSDNIVAGSTKSHLEDQVPTALESSSKEHIGDESEPDIENEAGAVAAKEDASHDGEMLSVDASSNLEVTHMPVTKTYSSRRKTEGRLRNGAMESQPPSARRLRSSLRTDPEALQNCASPFSTYNKNAACADSVRARSTRRNRRAGKPSGSLDRHAMERPAFVSNGSMEDSDSEIATVDSGSLSLNEGSSVESGCKPEYKCDVQCESEFELSQRLEFHNSAVIHKKKRKPNRKRLHTDLTESAPYLDKEAAPETFTARAAHILPSDPVKSDEKNSKELKDDGDEHLPLVKRARVRMGRSAPEGEVLDNEVHNEAKSPGVSDKSFEHASEGDGSSHQNTAVKSDAYDSSPSKKCSAKKTPFWEIRKQFGSSLDGESALPPSKRLHRALEAMSAYAADDDKKDMDELCRMKTSINGYSSSSKEECPELCERIKLENKSDVGRMESLGTVVQEDATQFVVSGSALEAGESLESLPEVPALATSSGCDGSSENVSSEGKHEVLDAALQTVVRMKSSDSTSTGVSHSADSKSDGELQGTFKCEHHLPEVLDVAVAVQTVKPLYDWPVSASITHSADAKSNGELLGSFKCEHPSTEVLGAAVAVQRVKSLEDCPPASIVHNADANKAKSDGGIQGSFKSDHPSPTLVEPSDEHCENEVAKSTKHFEDPHPEVSGKSADCGSSDELMMSSPEKDGIARFGSAEAGCGEINKPCQVSLDGSNQDNEESINMKETESVSKNTSATSSSSPEKAVAVSLRELHMSGLSTVSDDHLGDKAVSTTHSSSSLTDGMDSFTRAPTPNTLACKRTIADSSLHTSNGCSSPLPHQLHNKPRVVGKSSRIVEADVALGSFEAILRTLTRTKESIGRATRIALDCAKLGVASKVVEVIAQNLETESSLHKRVDLFFLVDSIAQSSRGVKGHIGGIYPSTILGVFPRLLLAAAPPGSSSQENRRQCLKVLRVWQERKILPESVIRPHIRELESFCGSSSSRAFSRRPSRTERNERSFDDPIREMEGMLVDEYGSNSSFQLPGFCMPPMLKDEEVSDSDDESFEAVTPEHPAGKASCEETIQTIEKHKHILEDVDGELEMEDVSPVCEGEIASISYNVGTDAAQISRPNDGSSCVASFHPPLPQDVPPSSPPLPTSPPPLPPPPPPPSFTPALSAFPPLSSACISTPGGGQSKLGSQNLEDNMQETVFQQCTAPNIYPRASDTIHCQPSDIREIHGEVPLKVLDSDSSRLSSNIPVSHPPFCVSNGVQPHDGSSSKGFHLRPPHPAPSNQFSFVHGDQRRDKPTPYPNVVPMLNADSRSFCRDRNGMKSAREIGECWMTPSHYSGPCYPDGTRGQYAGGPYPVPHEPPLPSHGWPYPPRGMSRREFHTHGPPPDRPIPVSSRGPGFWRPQ